MFTRRNLIAVEHVGLADGFFLCELFVNQPECLSAIADGRDTVTEAPARPAKVAVVTSPTMEPAAG